jgi:hypothetical protein
VPRGFLFASLAAFRALRASVALMIISRSLFIPDLPRPFGGGRLIQLAQQLGKLFRYPFGDNVGIGRLQITVDCLHHGGSDLGARGWSDSPVHSLASTFLIDHIVQGFSAWRMHTRQ